MSDWGLVSEHEKESDRAMIKDLDTPNKKCPKFSLFSSSFKSPFVQLRPLMNVLHTLCHHRVASPPPSSFPSV